VGVTYNTFSKNCQIVNEDTAAIPKGAIFNVRVAGASTPATLTFELLATPLNSEGDFTLISHPGAIFIQDTSPFPIGEVFNIDAWSGPTP
jgi:hypothetical protein